MNQLSRDLIKVVNGINHINNNSKQSIFTKEKMRKLINYVKIWSKIIKNIDLEYELETDIKPYIVNDNKLSLPNKKVLYIIELVLNYYNKSNYCSLPYDQELFQIQLHYYQQNHFPITFEDTINWYKTKYSIIPRYFYTLETDSEVYCNCGDFIRRDKVNYNDINPKIFKRKSDFGLFKKHYNKLLLTKYPDSKIIPHEYYL